MRRILDFRSIDKMSPKNPSLLALAEIPLAPGIMGHSIIAVQGEGDPNNLIAKTLLSA